MGDKKVKVSIIIPHYNQKECLQRLFPTLDNQTYKDFEVIIIDDCTPDKETISFVQEYIKDRPYMKLVHNEVNLRFVKTCNRGIKLAKGEYLCFLNSDTGVESTFVQRNVEILDSDSSIGGVTCIVVDQSGKNWFTGGRYVRGVPHNLHDDFQGVRTVEFIAGTAAFYRKDVFDRIGSFDENYIMYHEDIEFGLRVRKKTNYRLCTFSDKLVTHYIVPSIPGKALWYYASRNLVLLSKKYNLRYMPMVMAHILIHYAGIHVIRGVYIATFALRGVFDGLTGRTSHFNQ